MGNSVGNGKVMVRALWHDQGDGYSQRTPVPQQFRHNQPTSLELVTKLDTERPDVAPRPRTANIDT